MCDSRKGIVTTCHHICWLSAASFRHPLFPARVLASVSSTSLSHLLPSALSPSLLPSHLHFLPPVLFSSLRSHPLSHHNPNALFLPPIPPPLPAARSSPHDAEIFAIVGPALLAVFLDPVMTLVDTAIVGQLGAAELGGTGLASLIWNFSSALFAFLAVATTPKVALASSREDWEGASRTVGTTVFLAACIGLALGAGECSCPPVRQVVALFDE